MVYVLNTPIYSWDEVPYVSHELVKKQIDGVPLQPSDIPVDPQLRGPFDVPDICIPTNGFVYVSDRGRTALEELAPGCVVYFPINLQVPEHMRPAAAYFFIDVITRAQSIDWDGSKTLRRIVRAPDGRESRAVDGAVWSPSTRVKAATPEMPKIWREADVDRPTVHFFANKKDIFMKDEVWESLNARFPDQLVPRKLAES